MLRLRAAPTLAIASRTSAFEKRPGGLDDDERGVGGGHRGTIGGGVQVCAAPREERLETGFLKGAAAAVDRVHDGGSEVDSGHLVTAIRQHCRQRKAEFAKPDNRNPNDLSGPMNVPHPSNSPGRLVCSEDRLRSAVQ